MFLGVCAGRCWNKDVGINVSLLSDVSRTMRMWYFDMVELDAHRPAKQCMWQHAIQENIIQIIMTSAMVPLHSDGEKVRENQWGIAA